LITKRTEIRPRVKIMVLRCGFCDNVEKIPVEKDTVVPEVCSSCKRRALKAASEESKYVNLQRAEAQEPLERLRGGAPASHIELWFEDDLVNTVIPGQRVEITGVLRIRPYKEARGTVSRIVYSKFLDVVHLQRVEKEFEEVDIGKEDEQRIIQLSKDPLIYEKIIKSIAPSIYGYDEVKEALSLQLFSGTSGKELSDGGKIRSDIHILLIGDPGVSKCVSGDSKIVLADGSIREIKEVVEEQMNVDCKKVDDGFYAVSNHDAISLNSCGNIGGSKATHFWKLEAPNYLYNIKTFTGKEVITTPEHPFFVCDGGLINSVTAEGIEPGQYIATPAIIPINGTLQKFPAPRIGKTNASHIKIPAYVDERVAEIMGYIIGDGYIRKTTSYEINFTNIDELLLGKFVKNVRETFGLEAKVKIDHPEISRKVKTAYVLSVELGRIFEKMGLMKDSFNKVVPIEIQKSPNIVVKNFLKAYFDCEGYVSKPRPDIHAISASKELLEQVQILLLRFGIISQLHEKYARATNSETKKLTKYYKISITGENAKIFAEKIGFGMVKKQKNLQNALKDRKFNTNLNIVPGLRDKIKSLRKALLVTQFECGIRRTTYQHYERGDRSPSKQMLMKVVKAFREKIHLFKRLTRANLPLKKLRCKLGLSQLELASRVGVSQTLVSMYELGKLKSFGKYAQIARTISEVCEEKNLLGIEIDKLELLAKSDIFWDKVVEKKKIKPKEKWVYDFTVNDCHNFIANSIIVHNTRLLQYITNLAPKSIYVSGKAVTGAGLTATAERDELGEGGWTLKAGALVLASGGLAGIDEFDKIKEEEMAAMHEAMESQSVSVAKAGIVARFRAKTSILAAANPKYGRFDPTINPSEQFAIQPTILSRFDLIFPIKDIMDIEKDRKLADHILIQHKAAGRKIEMKEPSEDEIKPAIDVDLLRKYIAYARTRIKPVLTDEANEKIKEYYVDLRRQGIIQGAVPITPRYIEGLVRLAEASAKARLSNRVEIADAERAIKLTDFVLKSMAMDRGLGRMDIDIIATGQPKSKVDRIRVILGVVKDFEGKFDLVEMEKVVEEARKYDVDDMSARRIMDELIRAGDLYKPKPGYIKTTPKKIE
jgi:replicative DNA helicase Mcm